VNLLEDTARGFTTRITTYIYPSRGGHGKEPPEKLWRLAFGDRAVEKLKEKGLLRALINKRASEEKLKEAEAVIKRYARSAVDAVVAVSNYSTSHTRFREFLTRVCGCRYASMPLFDLSMLEGAMDVDWRALKRRTKAIATLVRRAVEVELTTPNGTHLRISKKGRKVLEDNGDLRRPGSFGNLPAGEVFFAPVEGTAEGLLVLEWAPTRHLNSPVEVTVKEGKAVDVTGREEFVQVLKDKFSERDENTFVAEFGIGTNDRARRPDNILESEKILGTVHVAFGDNSSFGGRIKTPFHQDFVFFHPTVKLKLKDKGEVYLIENGRLNL
ncbi:MAG: peptidase, partial [Nitrospirae bacterium]